MDDTWASTHLTTGTQHGGDNTEFLRRRRRNPTSSLAANDDDDDNNNNNNNRRLYRVEPTEYETERATTLNRLPSMPFEMLDRTASTAATSPSLERDWTALTEEFGPVDPTFDRKRPSRRRIERIEEYRDSDEGEEEGVEDTTNDQERMAPDRAASMLRMGSLMMPPTLQTARMDTMLTEYDIDDGQIMDENDPLVKSWKQASDYPTHMEEGEEDGDQVFDNPPRYRGRVRNNGETADRDRPYTDSQSDQPTPDDRQCRICFGDVFDEPALGRLISPCRCKGTMRHVHVDCLNQWRLSSGRSTSFFQCDQCGYKYSFQRTRLAAAITNPIVLFLVTLLVFSLLVLLGGFLSKLMLRSYVATYRSLNIEPFNLVLDTDTDPASPAVVPDTEALNDDRWWLTDMEEIDQMLALTNIDLLHLLFGLFLVGAVGFIQFLFGSAIIGPIPTFGGFGLRNAIRGNNAGGGQRGHGAADLVLLLVVLVGAARAIWTIYKGVRTISQRSLERLGLHILEVDET